MRYAAYYFPKSRSNSKHPGVLGPLELEIMHILWTIGARNVRQVVKQIHRELAYTTVMTTLDRLHNKGFLRRTVRERAFVYSPKLTREEWNRHRAREIIAGFLLEPQESQHVLLSCLVDAVGSHDPRLLNELENKIQHKRKELTNPKHE